MAEKKSLERAAKLQKLQDFRQSVPQCSKAALDAILSRVEQDGVPELHNDKQMREADWRKLSTASEYGPLFLEKDIVLNDGKFAKIKIVNYLSLLAACYKEHGIFHGLVRQAVLKRESTVDAPWQLLVYSDECWPGNPLSAKAEKKIWTVYINIKQLGPRAWAMEDMWLPVLVCRSVFVSKVAGHMGQLLKEVLLSIFDNPFCKPRDLGCKLSAGEADSVRIYLEVGALIQDGQAQKYAYGIKGDSGLVYCMPLGILFSCKRCFAFHASTSSGFFLVARVFSPFVLGFAVPAGSVGQQWQSPRPNKNYDFTAMPMFGHLSTEWHHGRLCPLRTSKLGRQRQDGPTLALAFLLAWL